MLAVTSRMSAVARTLEDYSVEITGKDREGLAEARDLIPAGAAISITSLPNEAFDTRLDAAVAVRINGFTPVPHIAARRLRSHTELEAFLARLRGDAGVDRAFVIAGDLPQSLGPYGAALDVIGTGLLAKFGVKTVGIAGYPEGHPDISESRLWQALKDKVALLTEFGHDIEIVTQFGFDADVVVAWINRLREAGVGAPVKVGVPGPMSVPALLRFAARTGVGASAAMVAKYGISLTKLSGVAGPAPFIQRLSSQLDPAVHGDVKLHFYTFGALKRTATWVRDYQRTAID